MPRVAKAPTPPRRSSRKRPRKLRLREQQSGRRGRKTGPFAFCILTSPFPDPFRGREFTADVAADVALLQRLENVAAREERMNDVRSDPPVCAGPRLDTRRPKVRLPAKAADCHCHVFGPRGRYPWAANRLYTPPPVTLEHYLAMLDT